MSCIRATRISRVVCLCSMRQQYLIYVYTKARINIILDNYKLITNNIVIKAKQFKLLKSENLRDIV